VAGELDTNLPPGSPTETNNEKPAQTQLPYKKTPHIIIKMTKSTNMDSKIAGPANTSSQLTTS